MANIQRGQIIKNYKEFCDLMGEKTTTGNGKINQLRRWSEIYEWTRNGHNYFISNVRLQPVKYSSLEDVILSYIYLNDYVQEPLYITSLELIKELEMIEDDFFDMVEYQHNNLDEAYLIKGIENIFNFLMDIVEKTIYSMCNKSLILHSRTSLLMGEELSLEEQEVWTMAKAIVKKKNKFNNSEMNSLYSAELLDKVWKRYNKDEEMDCPIDINKIILVDSFHSTYKKEEDIKMIKKELKDTIKKNLFSEFQQCNTTTLVLKKIYKKKEDE